jgi:hypothetical protein
LLLSASLRSGWIALMPIAPESDYATFFEMAQHLAAAAWEPNSYGWLYKGVGYPLILAPLLAIHFDALLTIRLTNLLLQLATVFCIWLLGRRLFGTTAALGAAAMAGLFPGLWLYVPLVTSEHLAILLLVALALLLCDTKRLWRVCAAGVLAAALVFTRPAFLALPVLMALAAACSLGAHGAVKRLCWFVLGATLVFGPIALLNRAHNAPVLPLGNSGWQLWLVNNERSTGAWFPAIDADDYPFKGLATGDSDASMLRAAQRKLALQFIAANPRQALAGVVLRHQLNWSNDRMGVYWTVERAPNNAGSHILPIERMHALADYYYVTVLALAAVASTRFARRTDLLITIILPLTYMVALYSLAEGNDRYHVPALPLLCVLAGAAFVRGSGRTLLWVGLAVGLTWGIGLQIGVGAWLVLILVLIPLILSTTKLLAAGWEQLGRLTRRHRQLTLVGATLLLAALMLTATSIMIATDRALTELLAVDPPGWRGYAIRADGTTEPQPLMVQSSDVRPDLRKVSYPDSVSLQFEHDRRPNKVIGLIRSLPGLTPGHDYRLYLQLFVPGPQDVADQHLTVMVNDRVVWRHVPQPNETTGWRYVSVSWTADATTVTIRIERSAGATHAASRGTAVLVRSLHLYPKY